MGLRLSFDLQLQGSDLNWFKLYLSHHSVRVKFDNCLFSFHLHICSILG